ncbi:MAG: hypothetical protein JSU87_01740 [Gemmatimonadota bacterium]|nr:MAG: hypothetical protein JSU87_01740 [Gemmatimonadota bacterium]
MLLHRRFRLALLTACIAAPGCRPEPSGPAEQLVDAWIAAAGGPHAWRQVADLRYTVTTVWFDSTGTETRRRPRYVWGKKDPQRARIERDEPEGHYVQAHDGRGTIWATLDGQTLADKTKAAREVLYVSGDVMYWIGLPYKLRDPGVNLGSIAADSTGLAGVRVTFGEGIGQHSGDRYFYYFDEGSPFPVEVHYIEEGSSNVNRTKWSDFQRAGPITYVGTRTYYDQSGVTRKQLIISDVIINPGLPDSLFLPPKID